MANISLFFWAAATAIILAAGLGGLKKWGTKGVGLPLCANTPKAPKSRARSLKRETTTCLFQPEILQKSTHWLSQRELLVAKLRNWKITSGNVASARAVQLRTDWWSGEVRVVYISAHSAPLSPRDCARSPPRTRAQCREPWSDFPLTWITISSAMEKRENWIGLCGKSVVCRISGFWENCNLQCVLLTEFLYSNNQSFIA